MLPVPKNWRDVRRWFKRTQYRIIFAWGFLAFPVTVVLGPFTSELWNRYMIGSITTSSGWIMAICTAISYMFAILAIIVAYYLSDILNGWSDIEFIRDYIDDQIEVIKPHAERLTDDKSPSKNDFELMGRWAEKTKLGLRMCTKLEKDFAALVTNKFSDQYQANAKYEGSKKSMEDTFFRLGNLQKYNLNSETIKKFDRNDMEDCRGM